MDDKLINIGKITKHQGNKGELRVIPLTDFPERFEFLEEVYLTKNDTVVNHQLIKKLVESVRFHKQFVILKLKDIDDINQAEEFRDYMIKIPDTELLPLEEDEFYIDDIIGFECFTDNGQLLGELKDILSTGGTDVFIVSGEEKDYMIPAAREIIVEVNDEEQKMIVKAIPGLLEL